MKLHDLTPSKGAKHKRKRIGRGPGSGHGKTPPKVIKDLRRARAVASAQGLKADRCRWLDEFLNMDL